MGETIAEAYVQILPTTKGIKGNLTSAIGGEAASAGKSAGSVLGSNMVGMLKTAIVGGGIAAVIKKSLDLGGAIQQSYGGLDTIYGDASEKAKEYAAEAAKAGISANDYAEQAVSFGASLKQAFEGDTTKAVEAANTAIMDMTDNAAKMGTPIENIQNAYQGFAKQNYTMLDNLKLGYGGTKTEMERLLKDATKLSGVDYNIDNLGDVYDAIHVIQGDLGLTGVAAQEASETFTGSFGAMKAAAENLLANLSLGEDISKPLETLIGNANVFLTNQLLPMVKNIFDQIPTLLQSAFTLGFRSLNGGGDLMGATTWALELLASIAEVLVENTPGLVVALFDAILEFGNQLINYDWGTFISGMIQNMANSLDVFAAEFLGQDDFVIENIIKGIGSKEVELMNKGSEMISDLLAGLQENLPSMLDSGIEIVMSVVNGILENAPQMITAAGEMILTFVSGILPMIPTIRQKGFELIGNLCQGLLEALPDIAIAALDIIVKLVAEIAKNYPQIIESGILLIGQLIVGIIRSLPEIGKACIKIYEHMKQTFMEIDWAQMGTDILTGIINGIKAAVSMIGDAANEVGASLVKSLKSALKIGSPSRVMRDEVGKWIPAGIAQGIEENASAVDSAVQDVVKSATSSANADIISSIGDSKASSPINSGVNSQSESVRNLSNRIEALSNAMGIYSDAMTSGQNVNISLEGDAAGIFRAVKRENNIFKNSTGRSAFA